MRPDVDTVVVGAGPYGLTATIQLRRAGIDTTVFGDPLSFWRRMPAGMKLRSNWSASSFVERSGPWCLDAFVAETGNEIPVPIPLESFLAYGTWVAENAVPDVDRRLVRTIEEAEEGNFLLTLGDDQQLRARRLVVACGIAPFAYRPAEFSGMPAGLVSHTSDHESLDGFAGRRVAVLGGGQSALETAALLAEAGAEVECLVRGPRVVWLRGHGVKKRLGRLGPVVYAPTDVGPLWYSRLVALPNAFRRLPRGLQDRIARRCIRPAGSHWVRMRLPSGEPHLDSPVRSVQVTDDGLRLTLADGTTRVVDHVMLGTGFRVDIDRYGLLSDSLSARVAKAGGYPILGPGLETSVPRLHVLGAPAAWSFGPIMRFVSGTWFTGRALVDCAARDGRRTRPRHRTADVAATRSSSS